VFARARFRRWRTPCHAGDAIELLFIGDTNRVIDETPQNPVSSRSHCIFTVFIEARVPGSERTRMSKLHLVDLAGSERVSKSGIEGKLLTEAKFINVSLHYLESVIKALSENQEYVPYRNSMMTSVLRDSLGGNCKTAMIATISFQPDNIGESIGTCRFAQRVACIATNAVVNEHVDPKMIIKRLKQEVAALKAELAFMKGVSADDSSLGPLTEEERDTYAALRAPCARR
jgi:kinesin family protein 6/9